MELPKMTANEDQIKEILEKIDTLLDQQADAFDEEDLKTLKDMIRAYRMWLSWGILGKWLIWLIITAAAVFAAIGKLRTWGM